MMMRNYFAIIMGITTVSCASMAVARVPVPDFSELEGSYAQSGATAVAQEHLVQAIPSGMDVDDAQAILIGAGATCRSPRRSPSVRQCLFHQYSLADGAADDIRWTISLDAPGDHVRTISVNRDVDRHGSN
jgi:hypothetical protein